MDWVWCPECSQPAEIVWRRELMSTDGPVVHAAVRCLAQHAFLMPSSDLTRADVGDESYPGGVRTGVERPGRSDAAVGESGEIGREQ